MKKISHARILSISFLMLGTSLCPAQEKLRTVMHGGMYRNYDIKTEPIAIVSREVWDKPFTNESQIVSGPDWLRYLTLGVKNISGKTIKVFEIDVLLRKQ